MNKIAFFAFWVLLCVLAGNVQAQSVSLLKLSELEDHLTRAGSGTVVVNFWATWCAPCIKELPYFQALHEKYSGSDVKVMLVSLDSKASLTSKVEPFVAKTGMTTDFYLLDETNQQEYIDRIETAWSGALPATVLINRARGKKRFIEGELTHSQLEEALKEVMN